MITLTTAYDSSGLENFKAIGRERSMRRLFCRRLVR